MTEPNKQPPSILNAASTRQAAQALREAHLAGRHFAPIHVKGKPLSEEQAYRIQTHLFSWIIEQSGGSLAGYKIGLTSVAMREMCGVAEPIYGRIPSTWVRSSRAVINSCDYHHLGLEFEIAAHIERDVTVIPDHWHGMAAFVDAVCPALELIDDRSADYGTLDGASMIADNVWHAGVVLGDWQPIPNDLQSRVSTITLNGCLVKKGDVGAVAEHPLAAVHWLATSLKAEGTTLRAGMIIMTGSLVKVHFPTDGDIWNFNVDGLGSVEIHL